MQKERPSLSVMLRERDTLIPLVEMARLLDQHPETLKTAVRRGRVPHVRIFGRTKFDPQTMAAWVEEQTVKAVGD